MVTENKEKLVYQVGDLVDLLGLSISSVYKGINSGDIPHVTIGSRILIPKKMLDEFLSKRTGESQPVKPC